LAVLIAVIISALTVSSWGISTGLGATSPANDIEGESVPAAAIPAAARVLSLRKSRRDFFMAVPWLGD
jgi:hypothetical protein